MSCGKISFDTFLIASISFNKSIDYYSPTINRICIRISCTGPVQVNKRDLAIKGFQKGIGRGAKNKTVGAAYTSVRQLIDTFKAFNRKATAMNGGIHARDMGICFLSL